MFTTTLRLRVRHRYFFLLKILLFAPKILVNYRIKHFSILLNHLFLNTLSPEIRQRQFIVTKIREDIKILNILNVDYETAINGLDGVKLVERYLQRGKMFDIILMDLIMPTMDGY